MDAFLSPSLKVKKVSIKNISNKENAFLRSQTQGRAESGASDPRKTIPTKRCNHCGESKPLDEFGYDSSKPDDRSTTCKRCKNEMEREYKRRRRARLMDSDFCQQLANLGMDLSSAASRSKVNVKKLEALAKGRNTMEDDEWARLKGIMRLEMSRRGVRWNPDEGVLK